MELITYFDVGSCVSSCSTDSRSIQWAGPTRRLMSDMKHAKIDGTV